jgi:hypothetical protein
MSEPSNQVNRARLQPKAKQAHLSDAAGTGLA